MRSIETVSEPNNDSITKRLLSILIITGTPLLITFALYLNNPDSQLLNSISAATGNLPVLLSAKNPLLSSVMNSYCKTAPFWALLSFILFFNKLQIKKDQPVKVMLKGVVLFSALYFPMMYMLLLHTAEITESGKLLRVMSQNDYLLTLLFVAIYTVCYVFTALYLFFTAAVFKTLSEKLKTS